ncbi:MAG: chemotaxis protein CheX [Nitrospirota bacterium]|jgi:CheY-specific phosphatase CheX
MEKTFVNALVDASRHVIESMTGTAPDAKPPVKAREDGPSTYAAATLGMTGALAASVSVCFSKDAIYQLHRAVLPDEGEVTFSSIGDLVGEIAGMICSATRTILAAQGLQYESSLPMVTLGDRQHIHSPSGTKTLCIPFLFEDSPFFIEVTFPG